MRLGHISAPRRVTANKIAMANTATIRLSGQRIRLVSRRACTMRCYSREWSIDVRWIKVNARAAGSAELHLHGDLSSVFTNDAAKVRLRNGSTKVNTTSITAEAIGLSARVNVRIALKRGRHYTCSELDFTVMIAGSWHVALYDASRRSSVRIDSVSRDRCSVCFVIKPRQHCRWIMAESKFFRACRRALTPRLLLITFLALLAM